MNGVHSGLTITASAFVPSLCSVPPLAAPSVAFAGPCAAIFVGQQGGWEEGALEQKQDSQAAVRFAGYAAIFDHSDRGGDIIRRGAFIETLARQAHVPLLWYHRGDYVIGRIEKLAEDQRGLRVIGSIDRAAGLARLVAQGQLSGLSFGYRVHKSVRGARAMRELLALDLVEISLVLHPMQPRARIIATEAMLARRDLPDDIATKVVEPFMAGILIAKTKGHASRPISRPISR